MRWAEISEKTMAEFSGTADGEGSEIGRIEYGPISIPSSKSRDLPMSPTPADVERRSGIVKPKGDGQAKPQIVSQKHDRIECSHSERHLGYDSSI